MVPNGVNYDSLAFPANSTNITMTTILPEITSTGGDDFEHPEAWISQFQKVYSGIHGYLSIVICIFGSASNLVNVIVLTRKHMISPTNLILTALAIADLMTMFSYLFFALYLFIFTDPNMYPHNHPKGWTDFVIICNHFFITCHVYAMWLTVALAVFRYIFVCHHSVAPQLCTLQRAKLTMLIVWTLATLFCIPEYFLYESRKAKDINPNIPANFTGWWPSMSVIVENAPVLQTFCFMLYGIVMKITTCLLLIILSSLLIYAMRQATVRRNRLLQRTHRFADHPPNEHNRTTIMLVAVVLSFVLTEFPQGILALISGLDENFLMNVYSLLGDLMDMLVLINSAVNFILYCAMSQQFRDTFKNIFIYGICPSAVGRYLKPKQNGVSTANCRTEVTQV